MDCYLFVAKPLSEPMMPYCQLDHKEHIKMKFYWKIKIFHSRKLIQRCGPQNGWHFVLTSESNVTTFDVCGKCTPIVIFFIRYTVGFGQNCSIYTRPSMYDCFDLYMGDHWQWQLTIQLWQKMKTIWNLLQRTFPHTTHIYIPSVFLIYGTLISKSLYLQLS